MSLLEGGTGKAARHKEETVEGVEECNRMCTKKQGIGQEKCAVKGDKKKHG